MRAKDTRNIPNPTTGSLAKQSNSPRKRTAGARGRRQSNFMHKELVDPEGKGNRRIDAAARRSTDIAHGTTYLEH
jgi:hypothetical protein